MALTALPSPGLCSWVSRHLSLWPGTPAPCLLLAPVSSPHPRSSCARGPLSPLAAIPTGLLERGSAVSRAVGPRGLARPGCPASSSPCPRPCSGWRRWLRGLAARFWRPRRSGSLGQHAASAVPLSHPVFHLRTGPSGALSLLHHLEAEAQPREGRPARPRVLPPSAGPSGPGPSLPPPTPPPPALGARAR